jgi:hypothetical protein
MDDQELYQNAKKKAESKIRFYIHLVVYFLVNILLLVINLKTGTGHLWFLYPLFGWGLAVFLHGLMVLGVFDFSAKKQRLIEKELAKEKYKKQMEENR